MSSALPTTPDELDQAVARSRRRRMSRFPPDTLLWLAALPEWTDRLAARVGFPPDGSTPLGPLLDGLEAARLLTRREDGDVDGAEVVAFWLPASRRTEVGELLRETVLPVEMAGRLRVLADRIRALPAPQRHEHDLWLAVVDHHVTDASGTSLLSDVDALVTGSRTTEALGLVGAAQALADVLGEPLSSSARRAQWRIDRSYREALDARTLRHHLPRHDIDAALGALLHGTADVWAVHLLGDGGVGKTMAIRDVCSGRFARRAGLARFPVARIDFDHLDPRYPDARPAELLAALSGELAPYSTTRQAETWFRRTDDAVARVHEEATAGGRPTVGHPLLDDAVRAFAGYLQALDGPVVLVLDTCEELAKLHPPGGRAPAVDQTFALLERIHDLAPRTRVVLAGRRWLVPPPPGTAAGLLLDPRPYLSVVPLHGFSREEADAYLNLRDPDAALSPPLRAALLARSAGAGGESNPFDLASYCDWALAEPALDPGALRTDGDPYVEQRILAHVPAGPVRDCLPVAAELGRFDRGMIEPELRRRGVDVEEAFSGLVAQEWVSAVTFDPDGRAGVIEVDPNLQPRLHAVLAAQPDRFPLDRVRLGHDLAAHLRDRPLDEPAVTAVEAALRLLPAPDAAVLWDELERRVAATPGAWAWAGPACARAAAAEAPRAGGAGPTVLAAIHATQAAVLLRQPGAGDPAPLWREVARLAGRHPDLTTGARLAFRATCALLDAGASARHVDRTWRHRPTLVDDAMVAAVDRMAAASALPPDLGPILDELCGSADTAIAATALLARAAAQHTAGGVGEASVDVEAALRLLETTPVPDERVRWIPGRLRDRARLARLVLAVAGGEPPEQFPLERWRAETREHLEDIDAERLAAATVFLEHCWHPVDPETGHGLAGADRYQPLRRPTHTWHHAVAPLCQVAATVIADGGDPAGAAAYLRSRREQAVAHGRDAATIGSSDGTLVALSRAFRTTALSTSVHRAAREGTGAERLDAWATLALVLGEAPASPAEAGEWSTWLRTQIARPGRPAPALAPGGGADGVDLLEGDVLLGIDPPDDAADAAWRRLSGGLVLRDGACPDLAAALRTEALCGWPHGAQPLLHRLPPRLLARTALAEAELLALRLPDRAVGLLNVAGSAAQRGGDPVLEGRAAVLLALTSARAGSDGSFATEALRTAVRNLPAEDPETSGWPDRRELALELVGDRPRRGRPPGGSPELDPRPLTGPAVDEPAAVPATTWTPPDQDRPPARTPPPAALTAGPPRGRRGYLAPAAIGVVAAILFLVWATDDGGGGGAPSPAPTSSPATPEPTASATTGVTQVTGAPLPTAPPALPRVDTSGPYDAWLGFGVVVAVLGVVVLLFLRLRYDARRPLRIENALACSVLSRMSPPERCRLTTTPWEIIVKPGSTRLVLRRRSRPPVAVLLGQRHGSMGGHQDLARRDALPDRQPLFVVFRQTRLPIVWQLWNDPPARGAPIATGYRGPAHLAPRSTGAPNATGRRAVLHLVGTPVSTAAGWRMRIPAAASSTAGYQRSSRSRHVGEELVGADDLSVDSTALVVVQAEPVDGPPQPLGEQYEGACALAADIRDAGAGAVLVVPPLPDGVARHVVDLARDTVTQRRHRLHPVHVLDLARTVKGEIVLAERPAAGPASAARDVLLFA